MPKSPTQLYRHFNSDGELLYVGISISAPSRQSQHKNMSPWFREVSRIEIENHDYREVALRIERHAIQTENPKYNIEHKLPESKADHSTSIEKSKNEILHYTVNCKPLYSSTEAASVLNMSRVDLLGLVEGNLIGSVPIGKNINVSGWQIIEFLEAMSSESYAEEVAAFLKRFHTPEEEDYIGRTKVVRLFELNPSFFSVRERQGLPVPPHDKLDNKNRGLYLVKNLRSYFDQNPQQLDWRPLPIEFESTQ